ncbi:Alpha/Beta hydrolase protein [Hypoxylon sp. NC1633]|nr:Alpha/Beta hydrolase protein [Hypoxylon sp. NC1633]
MSPCLLSLYFFICLVGGANFTAPALTGPYRVGTTSLEVIDYERNDIRAPTPQPRDLMISVFYPIDAPSHGTRSHGCETAVQIPALTAAYLEESNMLPNGSLHDIVTRACLDAPLSHPRLPLLFFSTGFGAPRSWYSDTLAEIASYGWNIVSVDHPYQAAIVEYPDGRVVYQYQFNGTASEEVSYFADNVEIRAADMIFVLNALSNHTITSQIPGYRRGHSGRFRTGRTGVFGHSLGGATALRVIANDTRFIAGANLDGSFWGSQQQIGTDAPFLIMAAENHTRTLESDPSWVDTWPNLRGFKRQYSISGAKHLDFTDLPIAQDAGVISPVLTEYLGSINSTRIIGIQRAFLNSFFKLFLEAHNDGLLDGVGIREWPEVTNTT